MEAERTSCRPTPQDSHGQPGPRASGDPEQNLELRKLDRLFIYEPDQLCSAEIGDNHGRGCQAGYRRTDGMRISDAVAAAGGVLPEAYLARADVLRHAPDGTSELIRVVLQDATVGGYDSQPQTQ